MTVRDNVLNAQETADFLGAHVETVRRLARRGQIPAFKLGKDWRFWAQDPASLDRRTPPATPAALCAGGGR